jgi:hypothetical protein
MAELSAVATGHKTADLSESDLNSGCAHTSVWNNETYPTVSKNKIQVNWQNFVILHIFSSEVPLVPVAQTDWPCIDIAACLDALSSGLFEVANAAGMISAAGFCGLLPQRK